MENKEAINDFLESNGFKSVDKGTSEYFGDYYDTFENDFFRLRFSSSKSFRTVDIQSSKAGEEWYDLALVKALLYNETNLTRATSIEEYYDFLTKELGNICRLFNETSYPTTKKKLNNLGMERARQLFPGMFK